MIRIQFSDAELYAAQNSEVLKLKPFHTANDLKLLRYTYKSDTSLYWQGNMRSTLPYSKYGELPAVDTTFVFNQITLLYAD
ncbi:hypothetical protein NPIL_256821 [Nephila pilipes]|uniref:Uncharacterized protein n=1 Tax=Nephila pilipes TaxID=299642 RepID=A0A8X6TGW2_NEPPI|nr:hypothetical protein NPIL_256821 [Nephila pilipes]